MPHKHLVSLLIGLCTALFAVLLFRSGFFATWQDRLSDQLFSPRPAGNDIAMIAIDDKSIQAIGRFPWNRAVYASLLEKLDNNPRVVAIDVSFPETSTPADDNALAEALQKAGNVILPIETAEQKQLYPIPLFRNVTIQGFVDIAPDTDGVNRKIPSVLQSFSYQALNLSVLKKNLPPLANIPTEHNALRINFAGGPGSFKTYAFSDVLNGTVPPGTFKDKIVLVGATALDLHDNQLTPTSNGIPMSGVEIHANAIQTMMDQRFLREESRLQTVLTVLAMTTVFAIAISFLGIIPAAIVGVIGLIGYIQYAIWSFDHGTIVNLILLPLSLLAIYILDVVYYYVVERKQKRFIRTALAHYLSESVMRDILKNPKKLSLGGERKEITVLFSDIAGFTSISEKLPPDQLVQLLNHYLTNMTHIVFAHNGVLDKYIGDAVMAFWGAPLPDSDQAFHACETALEMQKEIEVLRASWTSHNIPNFAVRIGVNTGDMAVGNMGSDVRFDYTLLGDNVNLGSRLEGINKEYETSIIISGSTYEQVKGRVIARRLDTVAVKGKATGVAIYELRGLGQPDAEEQTFLNEFENARALYEKGKFRLALENFKRLAKGVTRLGTPAERPQRPIARTSGWGKERQAPDLQNDAPTELYLSRCQELLKNPPRNWDGVFHAKSK